MINRSRRYHGWHRWQPRDPPQLALAIGIAGSLLMIVYGALNDNVLLIAGGCCFLFVSIMYAVTFQRKVPRQRPRGAKKDFLGRLKWGDWHPTHNARQYMLRRGRHAAKLGRQGREIEADEIEKETSKEIVRKDKRNI